MLVTEHLQPSRLSYSSFTSSHHFVITLSFADKPRHFLPLLFFIFLILLLPFFHVFLDFRSLFLSAINVHVPCAILATFRYSAATSCAHHRFLFTCSMYAKTRVALLFNPCHTTTFWNFD